MKAAIAKRANLALFKIRHLKIIKKYIDELQDLILSTDFEKAASKIISLPQQKRKNEYKKQAEELVAAIEEVHLAYCAAYLKLFTATHKVQTADKEIIARQNLDSFHIETSKLIKVLKSKADYYLGVLAQPSELVFKLETIKNLTYPKWINICLKGTKIFK